MLKLSLFLSTLLSITSVYALSLTSTDFGNNDNIPVVHTCDAQDVSPELSWSNSPDKTKSYALIVSDPDASSGTYYHWVVFNISKKMHKLKQGVVLSKAQAVIGMNSFNNQKYNGPCPPPGEKHRYLFNLYALDRNINLDKTALAPAVLTAIKPHVLAKAELVTEYKRH